MEVFTMLKQNITVSVILKSLIIFALVSCNTITSTKITPSLNLSPSSIIVSEGDAGQEFTAILTGSNEIVEWSLQGSGVLSNNMGTTTLYIPPFGVSEQKDMQLTAKAGSLTSTATITVKTKPSITVYPKTATIKDGSTPSTYSAILRKSNDPIVWRLEPNIGKLELGQGSKVKYTPPSNIAGDTKVKIIAQAGAVSDSVDLDIIAIYAAKFFIDSTRSNTAGQGKKSEILYTDNDPKQTAGTFEARVGNITNGKPKDLYMNMWIFGGSLHSLRLGSPNFLSVGDYDNAKGDIGSNLTSPRLNFDGDEQFCGDGTGKFSIKKLEFDVKSGNLKNLLLDFAQSCDRGLTFLTGTVVFGPLPVVLAYK
jgi:hypothetical protein